MKKILLLIMFAGLLLPAASRAQSNTPNELGKPQLTAWLPKDYDAATQNWAIVQDDRGVLYFGNNSGILEYDGVSWRLIQLPDKNVCRSLAKDANGRIYAGGVGDFGYLTPDSLGQMDFVSLLGYVPEEARNFADVWKTHILGEKVYFNSVNYLFRWTPSGASSSESITAGKIKIWKPEDTYHQSFVVNGVLYIREWGKGLLRMEGDSLKLVHGGEQFDNERIYVMLPFPDELSLSDKGGISSTHKILVGTRTQGMFLYDGHTFRPFKTEADEFLRQNSIYQPGAILPDGRLLLNTVSGGVVVLDSKGKLLQIIDRSSGLPDNSVYYVYSDPMRPKTQWLGLNRGIARVEAVGPFSYFDVDRGLTSTVTKIRRHRGFLYAATNVGVFYFDHASATFRPIDMPVDQSWDFVEIDGQLLAATNGGVFALKENQATFVRRSVNKDFEANVFCRSRQDSQRVFAGLGDGLASLRMENGTWHDEGRAPGLEYQIITLAETGEGMLWAGTSANGVLRIKFARHEGNIWEHAQVERFGPKQGLPDGGVYVYEVRGTPYFMTPENIFTFDAAGQRFVADSTFSVVSSRNDLESRFLKEDGQGRVWVVLGREPARGTPQPDGTYQWLKTPFRRFSDEIISSVYAEGNGVIWFCGATGLIRYDSNRDVNYAVDYPALVRRVSLGEDSLIFGGTLAATGGAVPAIAYANNNLRFDYSASSYEDASRLQFQTWLEGFDEHWSNWSNKTEKEYTNLPAGKYQFRVRARNVYEHVSREAAYAFSILPPWYGTWWAYFLYALLASGGIFAVVRVRTQKLHARGRELEAIVEKRTLEIRQQAGELETLDSIVQVINREVELKNVLNALLEQGLKLFPQAEKGAFLIRDLVSSEFRYQAAAGYDIGLFEGIVLKEEEVVERFSEGTSQLEEGVYIVRNLDERPVAEKFKDIPAPKSILAMTVSLQDQLGGVMFFDNLSAANAFDKSDVQKLKRFREHAVSAISKAKTLQELQHSSRELQEQKDKIQESYENVDLLSKIGKDITATLSIEGIIDTVYENVNTLMDASVFGIGLYNENYRRLEFPATKEKGETLPVYYYEIDDENRPASWCFRNRKEIFSNDWVKEHHRFVKKKVAPPAGERVESMIYLPLLSQDRAIGIITAQSFKKHAYTDYHLDLLRNMATYTTIALDNADAYRKLNSTLDDLKATQQQLVTQEKLASLGALTAGIAHEIKNPLNFVNNFADLSVELVEELREDLEKQKEKLDTSDFEELEEILSSLEQNAKKINEHGKRADSIVHSMLQHSRGKAGERQEIDINAMLEEDLNLAYHGMRARDSSFNVTMETDFDKSIGKLRIVPQDVSRVFLNILTNSFYEVHRKRGENGDGYAPLVGVSSKSKGEQIEIRIRDNGDGIPEKIRDKLFNPFFTTKPAGQGTGLGLSLSHDIIAKEHHGDITFESKEGEYTEFIITLPKNGR
jgi:signal transduction histidine kinase